MWITESPAAAGFERAHRSAHLVIEALRPAAGKVGAACVGGDRESRRHRQSQLARHHREAGRFASDEREQLVRRQIVLVSQVEDETQEVGPSFPRDLWISVHTRSGVRGRSRITTPVASVTADATAGAVAISPPSPAPLEP